MSLDPKIRATIFEKLRKMAVDVAQVCGGFCEEWKLLSTNFDQIQVKQIIFKDSGG